MVSIRSVVTAPVRLFIWLNYFSARKYSSDESSDSNGVNVGSGRQFSDALNAAKAEHRLHGGLGPGEGGNSQSNSWGGGPGGYGS